MIVSENEVLDFLQKIEGGEITLTTKVNPKTFYNGNLTYMASNGWEITIFLDADEWDYIDHIKIDGGAVLDFDLLDQMERIRNYEPLLDVIISRYGLREN